MPFEKHYDLEPPVSEPACVHLRSKRLFVRGDIDSLNDPVEPEHYCWCNLTQHVIGPDSGGVNRPMCIPGRSCFRDSR